MKSNDSGPLEEKLEIEKGKALPLCRGDNPGVRGH